MKKDLEIVLSLIALQNNTTVKEVRKEMEKAIEAGFSNTDPAIQAKWSAIPCKGTMPTLEEFLSYLLEQLD